MNKRSRKLPRSSSSAAPPAAPSSYSTPSTPTLSSSSAAPNHSLATTVSDVNTGILDERILMLVFRKLNWDPHVLCVAACVSRRLRAVACRILFRELCISRAPGMVAALTIGGTAPGGRLGGGWHALAKILLFCCGCSGPTRFFALGTRPPTPGHFVAVSRFSKTSGRSFLSRRFWGDLLYVSDPCEHQPVGAVDEGDDLGAYRGVFREFMRSRTRAWLIEKQAELETRVRCPYCGARVWSMTAAGLVPRSAARRLGTHEDRLEYFVCVNGHLHGYCWLAHLSTDGEDTDGDQDDEEDTDGKHNEDDDGDGHVEC